MDTAHCNRCIWNIDCVQCTYIKCSANTAHWSSLHARRSRGCAHKKLESTWSNNGLHTHARSRITTSIMNICMAFCGSVAPSVHAVCSILIRLRFTCVMGIYEPSSSLIIILLSMLPARRTMNGFQLHRTYVQLCATIFVSEPERWTWPSRQAIVHNNNKNAIASHEAESWFISFFFISF